MSTSSITRSLALGVAFVVCSSPAVRAEDTSVYRGFRLGMTVLEVATAAGIPPSAAKVVFERPLLIQELEWSPPAVASTTDGARSVRDSVAQVLFGFCNGELYRIVISYDPDRTEGLTEQDMVEAISLGYGPARTSTSRIIVSPAGRSYTETEQVTARWEDLSSSVNLFRGAYRSTFGLVIFSKSLAPLARAGIETGLRLDRLDAPRREVAERQAQAEIERLTHAKSRVANKAAFRF